MPGHETSARWETGRVMALDLLAPGRQHIGARRRFGLIRRFGSRRDEVQRMLWVSLLLCFAGCGDFDFEMEQVSEEVVLAGDPQAFRDGVKLDEDVLGIESWTFELEGKPQSVRALRATLELGDEVPAAHKLPIPFQFIDSLEYYIGPTDPDSKLPELKLVWLDKVTAGPVVALVVDESIDLFPYAKQGFDMRAVLKGRVPEADLAMRLRFVAFVDVF